MVLQLISGPFNEHKIAYIFCLEDPVKVFIEIKFFIKDFFSKYDQLKKNLNGKAINWNKKILPVKIKENMERKWEGRCSSQNLPVQSQQYKQKGQLELSR